MKNLFIRLAGVGILGIAAPAVATHLIVGVDPNTGASNIFLSAGALSPRGETPSPTGPIVYPSQQASLDPEPVTLDPQTTASILAQSLVDSSVIQALLANKSAIDAEHQQLLDNLAAVLDRQLGGGTDPDQLDRLRQNLDRLVTEVVQQAVSQVDLSEDELNTIIERATSRETPQNSPSLPLAEQQRQAQRQQLEQQRQEKQQQERQQQEQRRDQRQDQQELIARIQEQQRQQQEANQRAQEEARRRAEEQLLQNLDEKRSAQLKDRLLRDQPAPDLNPNAPVTPESYQNHLSGVSGANRNPDTDSSDAQTGSTGTDEPDLDASPILAGAPQAGETPGDVHTDYAAEEQRNNAVESSADDYLASRPAPKPEPKPQPKPEPSPEPAPDPVVDLEQLWLSFLANNDGPYTETFPTESIYGEAVGIYNGLVRGSFEDGSSANGTLQMSISFSDSQATGSIHFDDNRGTLQILDGWVGGTGFEIGLEGNAFGGSASGHLYGRMYGPNGEEIGGDWGMYVHDGEFADRSASGNFAAKQ